MILSNAAPRQNMVVGPHVVIGNNFKLHKSVSVYDEVVLENDVRTRDLTR